MRFKECVQAIVLLNQMIQGSQQKDRIGAAGREIQFAGVPSRDRCQRDAYAAAYDRACPK